MQSNALCRTNSSGHRVGRADHPILVQHDRVVERRALDQPHAAQRLDLVDEPERPRRRELLRERLARHAIRQPCWRPIVACGKSIVTLSSRSSDGCTSYVDSPSVSVNEFRTVRYSTSPGVVGDPGADQRFDERRRAAVHDRRLGGVEMDLQVIDAAPRDGREHVLHGVHGDGILTQLRAPLGEHGVVGERRNPRLARKIRSEKDDARPARRGTKR